MWQVTYLEKNVSAPFAVLQGMALLLADAKTTSAYFIGLSSMGPPKIGPLSRDTGNDFFIPQISGGSVPFPGTLNVV